MSWLSKATGIHIGGNWRVSKAINRGYDTATREWGRAIMDTSNLGWNVIGQQSPDQKAKVKREAERNADILARQAHDTEVASLGAGAAEAIRNRRRRGLYATILTGSGPTMGSPAASSGKQTLGA